MEDLVTLNGKQVVTSSRNVAEHFEKQHKDVLESIRSILAAENSAAKFFVESTYENRGKEYPEYLMNRDGFALLVMGFTGAKALSWKMKYIEAFNAMEKSIETPQIAPNPHYRTRMVGTAVRDIGKTAESIEQVFAVKHGMALASAMEMIGESYGIDTAPLKRLLPSEDHPGYLNPSRIAEKLGLLYDSGKPKAAYVNNQLASLGFQKRDAGEWRLTEKGRAYGEEKPFTRNGHSGYSINWSERIMEALNALSEEAQAE